MMIKNSIYSFFNNRSAHKKNKEEIRELEYQIAELELKMNYFKRLQPEILKLEKDVVPRYNDNILGYLKFKDVCLPVDIPYLCDVLEYSYGTAKGQCIGIEEKIERLREKIDEKKCKKVF